MAVCLVVTKGNLGGAQRYVETLANLLVFHQIPTIVVAGEGDQLLLRLARVGIDVAKAQGLDNSSIISDLRLAWWLGGRYRRRATNTFVFNSTKLLPIASMLSVLLPSGRVVFVCHGFPFIPHSRSIADRIKAAVFYWLLRRVKTVICVSEYVQSLVAEEASNRTQIVLARNTIDARTALELARRGQSDPRGRHSISLDGVRDTVSVIAMTEGMPLRAVSLAELNFNKGIDLLCGEIGRHRTGLAGRFEWHIYGEGKDRMAIEAIVADMDLGSMVFLHGFREDARTLIKDFDVLLIPSRNEAFGMVALEAAASGVYVCGVDVGGIAEAIVSSAHGTTVREVADMARFLAVLCSEGVRPLPPEPPNKEYWDRRFENWAAVHLAVIRGEQKGVMQREGEGDKC